jgi:rubrerythrin
VPEFVNPFSGAVPRKLTSSELARAVMLNIAAELEAVHLYTAHMDATDNEDAKKVLYDIALEELVHAGEFTSLLYRLDPVAAQKAEEGFAEVEALLGSRAPTEVEPAADEAPPPEEGPPLVEVSSADESEPPTPEGLTVGSLIGE